MGHRDDAQPVEAVRGPRLVRDQLPPVPPHRPRPRRRVRRRTPPEARRSRALPRAAGRQQRRLALALALGAATAGGRGVVAGRSLVRAPLSARALVGAAGVAPLLALPALERVGRGEPDQQQREDRAADHRARPHLLDVRWATHLGLVHSELRRHARAARQVGDAEGEHVEIVPIADGRVAHAKLLETRGGEGRQRGAWGGAVRCGRQAEQREADHACRCERL